MLSLERLSLSMSPFRVALLGYCFWVVLCQSDSEPPIQGFLTVWTTTSETSLITATPENTSTTPEAFPTSSSEATSTTTIEISSTMTPKTPTVSFSYIKGETISRTTTAPETSSVSCETTSISSITTTETSLSTKEGSIKITEATSNTTATGSLSMTSDTNFEITTESSSKITHEATPKTETDSSTIPKTTLTITNEVFSTTASSSQATTMTTQETTASCFPTSLSVVGSRSIRRNASYTVLLVNSGVHDVELRVLLIGTFKENVVFNKSALVVVPKKAAKSISFETFELPKADYRLSITYSHGNCDFEESINLVYNPKTLSVFVQTDKRVYSPGDRVRFRVIIVEPDTRPAANVNAANITMMDARANAIMHWPNAVIANGVFSSDMQLASSPVLGMWTIAVIVNEATTVETFEVIQYELPKFFVRAYPTETLLIEKKKVAITIESAHTSGQRIVGTTRVQLFLSEKDLVPWDTITTQINGKTNVEFTLANEISIKNVLTDFQHVIVNVSVTERFTNRTVNITQPIPVFLYPYIISLEQPVLPLYPGLPYLVQISVKDQYGEAPVNHKNLYITVRYEGNGTNTKKTMKQSLDRHGLTLLYLDPPRAILRLILEANYDSVDYGQVGTVEVTESQSTHYIRATLNPRYRVRVNKDVSFSISSTNNLNLIWYIITSRGCVITSSALTVPHKRRFNFRVKLTPEMAPAARLSVYTTVEKIIIFDQLELYFESFNHNVIMALDSEEYQPGQDIHINMAAAQDSQLTMQAIDQSVLVLGNSANGFDKNKVLRDLALYDYNGDAETNLFPVSVVLLQLNCKADIPHVREASVRRVAHSSQLTKLTRKPTLIRTVFPESWLWRSFAMDGKRTSVNDTVPDVITSWHISGFALSPTLGLGFVDQPKKILVKQPFYIIIHLPYSVKRNEVTLIEVTLYNYIGKSLQTDVKISNKRNEFEFVGTSSNATATRLKKTVAAPNNMGTTISFMIKARKLGDVTIKVEAKNLLASDSVEHILRVTPESHLYEKNEARFIELHERGRKSFKIDIDVPRVIDEGSLQMKFTLDAYCLGTAVKNLESLIHLPSGCGESNMVNFVPNIVILDYLSETSVVVDKVKSKSLRYLQSGYQNELKFKRSDGSFSVWGRLDSEGSTFLTAFVAKSFKLAVKYIDIDKSIITNAFSWLADVQSPNGRFVEVGQVFHADIQSGLRNNSIALTSYVLTAFLENQDIIKEHPSTVRRAVRFVARELDKIDDAYDLALTTYALSLAGHPRAKFALDKLIEKSSFNEETNVRYWKRTSAGVEIAGYAILSLIEQDIIGGAMEIIRWLSQQRYGRGGHAGTQDTFVGLKALAKLSAVISTQKNDYKVTVRHEPSKEYTLDINKNDAFAIQEFDLPSHVRQVRVEIDGIGYGVFQVAYQYYQNIEIARQSFKLNVYVLNHTTYHVQYLRVCVEYIPREVYQRSNMAMVEVFFPSGLVADDNSVQELSHYQQIRKTELRFAATSVVVYYDNLGPEASCFQVTAYRRYKVAENRPANVVVYDYYAQDYFAVESYEGRKAQLCDICEDEECESLSCP